MMLFFQSPRLRQFACLLLLVLCVLGCFWRFNDIKQVQFVYYDEGLYLDHTRMFVDLFEKSPPKNLSDKWNALKLLTRIALSSNKALWYLMVGLRVFFFSENSLFFTRLLSAIFGTLSIYLTYLFSYRFFQCRKTALLAAAILAVLPSHLYYSRLGLQEMFSAFCFLAAVYVFIFPKKLFFRSIGSGFLFACCFFANYRMIVLPGFIVFIELFLAMSKVVKFDVRKIVWCLLTFFSLIFIIGDSYGGDNTFITFGWMFHQANLAKGHFSVINLFSYPYYLFSLENVIFGLLFFGCLCRVFLVKANKGDYKAQIKSYLPFLLVCLQMVLFSLPQEKGARYICVVIPFMAMSVASFIVFLYHFFPSLRVKKVIMTCVLVMLVHFCVKDLAITDFHSDYHTVIEELLVLDPNAKIVSTQPLVHSLLFKNKKDVKAVPQNIEQLMTYYAQGYRYLILCPQAYISYTADEKRFSTTLAGPYSFVMQNIKPLKVFDHFNDALLQRFVLEHNENLLRSIDFLKANKEGTLGALYVYDIGMIVKSISKFIEMRISPEVSLDKVGK